MPLKAFVSDEKAFKTEFRAQQGTYIYTWDCINDINWFMLVLSLILMSK